VPPFTLLDGVIFPLADTCSSAPLRGDVVGVEEVEEGVLTKLVEGAVGDVIDATAKDEGAVPLPSSAKARPESHATKPILMIV